MDPQLGLDMTVRQPLMPVSEALERLLAGAINLGVESVALSAARGRILAEDLYALRTQPPFSASAMDGYAVRSQDLMTAGVNLKVIGEIAAGYVFKGKLANGEAARIFTGAALPEGADAILIQEDAHVLDGELIRSDVVVPAGNYVRGVGLDFTKSELLLEKGRKLDAGALSLAASGNHPSLKVYRKPIVGILATGDELRKPGSDLAAGQIIASNSFGVAAIGEDMGAAVVDLGIAKDDQSSLQNALASAVEANCDVLVTLGGASVGDHDLVRSTFINAGMALDFWKIAMQPGKPLMFGALKHMRILGLPGNPVSSLVCSHLFLSPLIGALAGKKHVTNRQTAKLENDIGANGKREQYARAIVTRTPAGFLAEVFENQDSSILTLYAQANALVVRPVSAPPGKAGDNVEFISIRDIE